MEAEVDPVIAKDPLNNMTSLHDSHSPVGNKLAIEFSSDGSKTEDGFVITFEDSKYFHCGKLATYASLLSFLVWNFAFLL